MIYSEWAREIEEVGAILKLKSQLAQYEKEAKYQLHFGDLGIASKIVYEQIPHLKHSLELAETSQKKQQTYVRTEVNSSDIENIVRQITGIPVPSQHSIATPKQLLKLPLQLKSHLVGQDSAIDTVCRFEKAIFI